MTHFLARLVERARGTAPRVEPLIAPRFAPAPPVEIAIATEADSNPSSPSIEAKPRSVRKPREDSKNAPKDQATREEKKATPEFLEIVRETLLVPSPPEDSQLIVRQTDAAVEANDGTTKKDAVEPTSVLPRGKVQHQRRPLPIRSIDESKFSPNEPAADRPIVHVTIGRIEVRAAAAPMTPARRKAPPAAPKLTLDAYLKARKEGAR